MTYSVRSLRENVAHGLTTSTRRSNAKNILFIIVILYLSVINCLKNIQSVQKTDRDYDTRTITLSSSVRKSLDVSSKTDASDMQRFNQVWPKLKKKLCPHNNPSQTAANRLFSVAWHELGLDDSRYKKIISPMKNMFTFTSGASAYISPDGKLIIYLRIYKAANDQLSGWFKYVMGKQNGTLMRTGYTGAIEKNVDNLYADITRQYNWTMEEMGENSCVVTAVRDPVSRFLAGYHEIEYRAAENIGRIRLPNPHPLLYTRYKNGTKKRFETFVADFVTDMTQRRIGVQTGKLQFNHLASMVGVLFNLEKHKLSLTDYLPTLTNLSTTWPKFLNETCTDFPQTKSAIAPMDNYDDKAKRKDPYGFYEAAKEVWKDQGETARALCAINAVDYACYDKIPVPPLCQDVFASEICLGAIL